MENYGRLNVAIGLHSRLLDFLHSLDFIIEQAKARQVDLVVFSGDAFRSREPYPTLQCLFAERIGRLSEAGIPLVLVAGNHDLPPLPGRKSALDIYPILSVPGVHAAITPLVFRIETKAGPVEVACLPAGTDVSGFRLGGSDGSDWAQALVESLAQRLTGDCPAILAGHVSVHGAQLSSEGRLAAGRELMLPREALAHPAFCYVALGHIHRFQDLNPARHPPIVYAGSPDRVDFSEEDEAKGFVLVDIDSAHDSEGFTACYDFIETPARRFVTIDVNLEAGESTAEVLEAIAAREIHDAVVKVLVRSQEEIPLNEQEIHHALQEASFALPLLREVEAAPERLRAPELAQGWHDPLVALGEYLKTTRLSEERKRQLYEAAEKLVLGARD